MIRRGERVVENYSYIETRKVFSRLGFALTFSILSVNVVQLIVAGFMSAVDPNLLMTDWANFFLIAVSFYLIGFPNNNSKDQSYNKSDKGELFHAYSNIRPKS